MTQINTNVNSLIAQRVLGQQNDNLSKSLERLSTGLRINRGADDPAGLIASENLRSEQAAIESAIGNAERADQVMNIAEGGLQEVNSLLLELQSLVGQSANDAGLSTEEKEANQQQIDSILQTIDRIAQTTSFQGTKLLNGSMDFTISGQAADVSELRIDGAKLGQDNVQVDAMITQSAQVAGLALSLGSGSLDLDDGESFVIELGGAHGSREFTFSSGMSTGDIADQINTFSDVTGVEATASGTDGGSGVVLKSTEFGSDAFVSVNVINDGGQNGGVIGLEEDDTNALDTGNTTNLDAVTNAIIDRGQDIGANVNGIAATGDGRSLSVNTDALQLEMSLTTSGAQSLGTVNAFTITGGGAEFNLGPSVNLDNQVRMGVGNVAARNLGSELNGHLSDLGSGNDANVVDGDLSKAQNVVDDAIKQVSSLRGRLGAFQQNTVGSTIRALNVSLENTSAAESQIRDADFAKETAAMTRNQILVQAATNALGIANNQPQNALSLLG